MPSYDAAYISPTSSTRQACGALHVAFLTLIAAYFLIFPIYRGFFSIEIGPNESWNAYHQDAALGAGPLYPAPDALIVNNYPPISFYVISWTASWTGGDALFVGRVLSVAAILGLGFVIALVIRKFGGGWTAGAVGATWFVGFMAATFDQHVGEDDPQLFGQFMMACALLWFLARDARGLSAEPPILLMVVIGFWKHNIIAIPATVLLWLILRDGRRAIRPCLFGIGSAVAGLALCIAIYGPAFISNLLGPRQYVPFRMLIALGKLQWVLPVLIIWSFWAWRERNTRGARFTALFIVVGLVGYVLQWNADAVGGNAQYDLDIAAAIGLGLAYQFVAIANWSSGQARALVIGIVALRLVVTGNIESALILFDPSYRRMVSEHAQMARAEAERVARIPGLVACSNKLICRMAGKPFVYDDFKVGQLVKTGAISPAMLQQIMHERGIAYVTIDPRANAEFVRRDWLARVFSGAQWN